MDLIDREQLKATIRKMVELTNEYRVKVIGAISRAKAIDIVRCKDCGLCVETVARFGKGLFCRRWNRDWQRVQADDFCSYGERKVEDGN